MRRSQLRSRSPKGQRYQDEYKRATEAIKARSGGRCEIVATHECDGWAQPTPHHRKMRSQGGSNSVDNLLDVCFTGHVWIHQQLPRKEAELLELLVPRDVPEYPYNLDD